MNDIGGSMASIGFRTRMQLDKHRQIAPPTFTQADKEDEAEHSGGILPIEQKKIQTLNVIKWHKLIEMNRNAELLSSRFLCIGLLD